MLVLEIHDDKRWNSWRRDARTQELRDARDVFVQWERAEPGSRMMTADEVPGLLAELKKEHEAETAELERRRLARKPFYDSQREHARLALLEMEAPGAPLDLDLGGLGRLRQVVGDPETVCDRHGWLPSERREFLLSQFNWWRNQEIRRLQIVAGELRAKIDETSERATRGQLRRDLELEDERRHILEVIPQLDASAMCSECVSPLGWHDDAWPIRHPAGPCPAWPAWAEHRRIFRAELAELRRRRAEAEAAAQPKIKPIAVIPSGLPVEDLIARLGKIQTTYPGAIVRRGSANKWEIWPPKATRPPHGALV